MDSGEEQHEHQDGVPQQPMHPPPPAIYGYPVEAAWGPQGMMHPHHMHPGQRYPHPMHNMEGVPLPPGIPGVGGSIDPLESVLGPFPCARLRSLPFDATIEDILVLFQGLVVIDIILSTGTEAYVVFANPMDYQMALQRNRQLIRRSLIEISPASRTDYYGAVSRQQWQEQPRDATGLITGGGMKGLWGGVTPQAPIQSLSEPVTQGGNRGGPTGSAIGGKGKGAGRSTSAGGPPRRSGGGIQEGEHTGILRMRGLPFSATKDDIAEFFKKYNPVPDSIVLTYRSDGRATGEAYVGFESPEASKEAMELHKKSMGNRYIELFLSNKEEHGRALTRFGNR